MPSDDWGDKLFGDSKAVLPGWNISGYVWRVKSGKSYPTWQGVKARTGTLYGLGTTTDAGFLALQEASWRDPKPATITTTVRPLVVGQQYELSWSERTRPSFGPMNLTVTAGRLTISAMHAVANGWAAMSTRFTATEYSMEVQFRVPFSASSKGSVLLDSISLRPLTDWRPFLPKGAPVPSAPTTTSVPNPVRRNEVSTGWSERTLCTSPAPVRRTGAKSVRRTDDYLHGDGVQPTCLRHVSVHQSAGRPARCLSFHTIADETEHGSLGAGLGGLTSFYRGPDQVIRLEWGALKSGTFGGSGNYIQFRSARNPFVDRIGELKKQKTDNQIFQLQDFETSDAKLASWVKSAGGAVLCVAVATGIDTAWAILPMDHSAWGHGCNGGSWTGRGAYYGVYAVLPATLRALCLPLLT